MEYSEYIPLIIGAVEALKEFGVQGKWSALTGIVLGALFSLGMDFMPEVMAHVIRALTLALAVPGFYMLGKRGGRALLEAIKGA